MLGYLHVFQFFVANQVTTRLSSARSRQQRKYTPEGINQAELKIF